MVRCGIYGTKGKTVDSSDEHTVLKENHFLTLTENYPDFYETVEINKTQMGLVPIYFP